MKEKVSVKERIVETASRLFYHQGFNSTGINQIIKEADIAIGSLYKHFQSKEDLLCYYLEQEEIVFFSNLDDYLKNEHNPQKKLLKLIDYRIELQRKSEFSGCHFIKINAEIGRQNKKVEKIVVDHKQRQRDYLKNIINTLNPIHEKQNMANTIFLLIEGAVVSSSIVGNTNDLEAVKEIVFEII